MGKPLHRTDADKLGLAPLADWHVGSPQCRWQSIKKHVAAIAEDPGAVWLGMGDLTENATRKSVGDVFWQTMSPDEQVDAVVDLLKPIKDRCLGMIAGNHGQRTVKETGLDPDKVMADLLGVPYFGYTLAGSVIVKNACYTLVAHHTHGGGATQGGRVNALAKLALTWPFQDIYLGAHTHGDASWSDRVRYTETTGGHEVNKSKRRRFYACSSALDYAGSYAEAKNMPPATTSQIVLRLGRRVHIGGVEKFRKPVVRHEIEL